MGKHFDANKNEPKRYKHSKKRDCGKHIIIKNIVMVLMLIVVMIIIGYFFKKLDFKQLLNEYEQENISKETEEEKKLVLKSSYKKNKIIEYIFINDKVSKVEIYEQFENIEQFNNTIESYQNRNDMEVIFGDENDMSIKYEKKDLGTDSGLSYDEIYNKYMKIVGAYQVVE